MRKEILAVSVTSKQIVLPDPDLHVLDQTVTPSVGSE